MRRTLAAAVCAVAVTACGEQDAREAERAAADRYVRQAQAVLERDRSGLQEANDAYVAFSRGELDPDETAGKMRAAERTIIGTRDGIVVLDPSARAQRLHDRLLAYLDLNGALAAETTQLAAYTPAAERTLAPIDRLNRRLASRISRARDTGAQVRALKTFEAGLERVRGRLRRLEPPPVLVPAHRDQVRRLDATGRLAGRLRVALVERDRRTVGMLLKRFRAANRSGDGVAALARQSRIRYAERVARLRDAYVAVQRETTGLQRRLR